MRKNQPANPEKNNNQWNYAKKMPKSAIKKPNWQSRNLYISDCHYPINLIYP